MGVFGWAARTRLSRIRAKMAVREVRRTRTRPAGESVFLYARSQRPELERITLVSKCIFHFGSAGARRAYLELEFWMMEQRFCS